MNFFIASFSNAPRPGRQASCHRSHIGEAARGSPEAVDQGFLRRVKQIGAGHALRTSRRSGRLCLFHLISRLYERTLSERLSLTINVREPSSPPTLPSPNGKRVRRHRDDHRAARPAHPSLRHHRDLPRSLALQEPYLKTPAAAWLSAAPRQAANSPRAEGVNLPRQSVHREGRTPLHEHFPLK